MDGLSLIFDVNRGKKREDQENSDLTLNKDDSHWVIRRKRHNGTVILNSTGVAEVVLLQGVF